MRARQFAHPSRSGSRSFRRSSRFGFKAAGSGFRFFGWVQGLRFRASGLGFEGLGFTVWGCGFGEDVVKCNVLITYAARNIRKEHAPNPEEKVGRAEPQTQNRTTPQALKRVWQKDMFKNCTSSRDDRQESSWPSREVAARRETGLPRPSPTP